MRQHEPITRLKVDAEPGAERDFTKETHLMQDWSDKLLDLILNGPTLNGVPKDEVRALLRQTYKALKGYETIGPMATPFVNDPAAIVALAFRELYPDIGYQAQLVPEIITPDGGTAFGETLFPEDGGLPVISISAEAPANAVPELLAHELAHIVAGPEADHGPAWEAAEDAIGAKYDEIIQDFFPDEE